MNHRKYVGGNFDEAGKKQIDFLRAEGLQPYHRVLDIGCGCLRAGRFFIDYLDPGNYFGVEKHEWLTDAGIMRELNEEQRNRQPHFAINDNFDFSSFGKSKFDYAIAKSVFTHLTKDKIKECLDNLLPRMRDDGYFFSSISDGSSVNNPEEDNETKRFRYTIDEIRELAEGWTVTSLGHSGCFNQTMLKFVPIKKDIKVSIVTAAFRSKSMDTVLKSISSQSFQKIEWIIVNDGQKEIEEWYEKRLPDIEALKIENTFVNINKTYGHFGLYSRNIGAMLARHDRIVFLDDDNEWEEDFLSSMVEAEETTGKIPYCWIHIIGKKPGSTFEKIKRTHFGRQGIDLGCLLYRKEHFNKYGFFQDSSQVMFDYDYMFKLFEGEGRENFICTKKANFIFHHKRY